MKKQLSDTRSASSEIQQHNRYQAAKLYNQGKPCKEIAQIIGIHLETCRAWIRLYQKHGRKGLQLGQRGRRNAEGRKLSAAQEKALLDYIQDKSPDQLKLPYALWNRRAVQELVWQQWRILLAIRTVGDNLKRWGFSPQKPLKRAYEQSPKAVKSWLENDYPALKQRAKEENVEIYWGDETGVRNLDHRGRGYAPRGKTPTLVRSAKRFSTNMISAVNNQGKVRFMIYQETMTAKVLIQFLRRLTKDANRKVFLILDNLRVHHAKLVRAWLAGNSDKIEIHYLPAYCPELNPDEYLNGCLKESIGKQPAARSHKELESKVRSFMKSKQRKPNSISKLFRHPAVAYAA